MRFSGSHFLCRVAGFVLIALLSSPLALCQWDARPQGRLAPLTSGPATVLLVARLESLSVTAAPAVVPAPYSADSGTDALAVTTSWTMRAECTTLRVMTHFGTAFGSGQGAQGSGGGLFPADAPDSSAEYPVQSLGQNVTTADAERMLMTQPIGATSRPGSRINNIQVVMDRKGHRDNPTLDILIQAL